MRVIRSLRRVKGGSRPARVKRVVRRLSHSKKFDEFEDIPNGNVERSGLENIGAYSERSNASSPRSAFAIVSEYLNHATNFEENFTPHTKSTSFPITSQPDGIHSKSNVNASKLRLRKHPRLRRFDSGVLCRRGKYALSTRGSVSRFTAAPQNDSSNNSNIPKPLSDVSNVLKGDERHQLLACDSSDKGPIVNEVSHSQSSRSLPLLKTFLTRKPEVSHPYSLVETTHASGKLDKNVAENPSPTSSNGVAKVVDKTFQQAALLPEGEQATVIVTITKAPESASSMQLGAKPNSPDLASDSTGILSDVHTLIRCTALAGSDFVDNNGLANHAVISHINNAVLPPRSIFSSDSKRTSLSTRGVRKCGNRRGSCRSVGDLTSSSQFRPNVLMVDSSSVNDTRHPFLHFWESESDRTAVSRGWRSRRRAYLSLQLSHTEAEQANFSLLSPRQARRRPDYNELLHPLGKGGVFSRYRFGRSPSLTAEWNAQNQRLSQLEPMILGYRWSDTNEAVNEANRDVLLMWN